MRGCSWWRGRPWCPSCGLKCRCCPGPRGPPPAPQGGSGVCPSGGVALLPGARGRLCCPLTPHLVGAPKMPAGEGGPLVGGWVQGPCSPQTALPGGCGQSPTNRNILIHAAPRGAVVPGGSAKPGLPGVGAAPSLCSHPAPHLLVPPGPCTPHRPSPQEALMCQDGARAFQICPGLGLRPPLSASSGAEAGLVDSGAPCLQP